MSYHAHFDCFSGAAGDMMLAACLDAADHLPQPKSCALPPSSSQLLLARITSDLERGMPELKGEFGLSTKRVWRSLGRIAARKVDVTSVYRHVAAPVPGAEMMKEQHEHSHEHEHSHQHEHQHEHQHKHDHGHNHNHDNTLENVNSSHTHEHSHAKEIVTAVKEPPPKEDPHDHSHHHSHGHAHSHHHDHSNSKLRNLSQISKMLREADVKYIPSIVAKLAIEAFTELAIAEMHTHGASNLDSVHFHEVGAVDSIVDTVGTLLALYHLGVDLGDDDNSKRRCSVSCSPLPLGEGTVWTDHGLLPVPAPATMRLMVGMPTCPGPRGVTGELVTPTAAALLRVLTSAHLQNNDNNDTKLSSYWQARTVAGRPPPFTPRAVGIGAGTKDFEKHANILRLVLGDDAPNQRDAVSGDATELQADEVGKEEEELHVKTDQKSITESIKWDINTLTHLEANIDDATPELLAHTIDLLLQNGAVDAWIKPIVMKKGRPAHHLNCICRSDTTSNGESIENHLLEIIFRHTTTLGIRIQRNILRAALHRRFFEVQLPYTNNSRNGKVEVKISSFKDGEVTSVKAEFDQCKIVSIESNIPLKLVTGAAERIAWDQIL